MIDQKLIIKEDRITIMLVATMGVNFPNDLLRRLRADLDGECSISSVCSFEKPS
jgi:hypothetical protein